MTSNPYSYYLSVDKLFNLGKTPHLIMHNFGFFFPQLSQIYIIWRAKTYSRGLLIGVRFKSLHSLLFLGWFGTFKYLCWMVVLYLIIPPLRPLSVWRYHNQVPASKVCERWEQVQLPSFWLSLWIFSSFVKIHKLISFIESNYDTRF
jgi:hypothetical protein